MSNFIKVRDTNGKGEWRTVICERHADVYTPIPQYDSVAVSEYYAPAYNRKGEEKPLQVISRETGVREVVWEADSLPE